MSSSENLQAAPIRVLHLRDSPWIDGPSRTILESGTHFDASRVEYHIAAFVPNSAAEHPLTTEASRRGLRTHRIVDRGGVDRQVIQQIRDLLRRHRIQILHTSDIRTNLYGYLARQDAQLKLISTAHGWIANSVRRRVMRAADKCLLSRFDLVIAVSEATRALLPRLFVPPSRSVTVHNALVTSKYGAENQAASQRMLSTEGPIRLMNVGRLSPEKGQHQLLHAFATLKQRHPRLELRFAGTGPLENSLRALARKLDVADSVEFLGYISDMPALYRQTDLVVQSSLTEGLPNVVLEAAFLRVPMVATSVGGTDEVVRHGESAWLIRPGSVQELTDGIATFLGDPERFARFADVAHRRILDNFTFDARTERMTKIYEHLAGRTMSLAA